MGTSYMSGQRRSQSSSNLIFRSMESATATSSSNLRITAWLGGAQKWKYTFTRHFQFVCIHVWVANYRTVQLIIYELKRTLTSLCLLRVGILNLKFLNTLATNCKRGMKTSKDSSISCRHAILTRIVTKYVWQPETVEGLKIWEGGTVCSNGFYADISNQHQVQQYKSCLKSFL